MYFFFLPKTAKFDATSQTGLKKKGLVFKSDSHMKFLFDNDNFHYSQTSVLCLVFSKNQYFHARTKKDRLLGHDRTREVGAGSESSS